MITKNAYGKSTSKFCLPLQMWIFGKIQCKNGRDFIKNYDLSTQIDWKRSKNDIRYNCIWIICAVLNWTAKITRIVSRLDALECTCSPYFSFVSQVLRSATFILVAGIWFGGRCFAGGEIERFERRVDAQKSFTKSVKHLFDLREYTSS